ncbi:MAG: DUF2029 domain-containing protein [Chloroflexi bacterium]|nr:DUF2029 domain-containing protein [Chloroflexota bacterium]
MMKLAAERLRQGGLPLLCVLLGLGLAVFWYVALLEYQALASQGGNYSDLYPRWLGARELLLHGRNPYSEAVTADIQRGFYGRALEPGGPIRDLQAFAYPLTVALLLAPFVTLPFSIAAPLVVAAMLAGLVAALWAWTGTLGAWRRTTRAGAVLLVLLSVPFTEAVVYQQLTPLSLALLAAAGALLWRGRLAGAGLALAVASFKPQLAILPLLGVALWAASAPRTRAALLLSLGLGLGVPLGLCELLLPGWTWDFIHGVQAYTGYVGMDSPLVAVLGRGLPGLVAGAAIASGSLWLWWRARLEPADSPAVQRAFALSVAATVLLVPGAGFYNKGLLALPLLYLLARPRAARREKAESRRQKAEGRRQKAEGRRQKAEGRRQKAVCLLPSAFCLLPSASSARGWACVAVVQLTALVYLTQALTGLLLGLATVHLPPPLALFSLVAWQYFLPWAILAGLANDE